MIRTINTLNFRHPDPLNLIREDLAIWDIAHALSHVNRFGGHTILPISVAQHSVFVSLICGDPRSRLQALLHDAAEAYLGDMMKPMKDQWEMRHFREAEERAQAIILKEYGCPTVIDGAVNEADRRMLIYEFSRGYPGQTMQLYPPLTAPEVKLIEKHQWRFWTAPEAKAAFLSRFYELT